MIVPIVGEELGLLGVLGLLVAFGLVAWCGYSVALRAKDPFGKLLAAGLTTLIVGQALLNIGGTLGVLPFTGVPVPLISYGGTSLVATLAAIGLVLSVGTYGGQALRAAEPARSGAAQAREAPLAPRDLRRQRARPRPARRARGAAGRCDAAARAHRGRRHRRARDARARRGRGARARRRRGDVRRARSIAPRPSSCPRAATRSTRSRSGPFRGSPRSEPSARSRWMPSAPVACVRILRRRRPHVGARGRGLRGRADAPGRPRAPHSSRAHGGRCAPRRRQPARGADGRPRLPGLSAARARAAALRGGRAPGRPRLLRDHARRGARGARACQRTPSCSPSSARSPAHAASTTRASRAYGARDSRTAIVVHVTGARDLRAGVGSRHGAARALPHHRLDRSLLDGAGGRRPRREPRRRHGLGARGGRACQRCSYPIPMPRATISRPTRSTSSRPAER